MVNKRTMQFNPVINTSLRGHGKWGDFLVALIPLSWCGNILVNSNFILRMIEWQNEGSLFTLRVQGKQWYWSYKFDATAVQNILAAPKNIGNNNWLYTSNAESYISNAYTSSMHMGAQLEHKELYFKLLKDDDLTRDVVNSWTEKSNWEKFYETTPENLNNLSPKFDRNLGDYLTLRLINIADNNFHKVLEYTWNLYTYSVAGDFEKAAQLVNNKHKQFPLSEDIMSVVYFLDNKTKQSFLDVLNHGEINVGTQSIINSNFITKTYEKNELINSMLETYDNKKLDDTSKFASNLIISTKNKPLQLLNGVLNKHNISILQNADEDFNKSVLFVAKFWLNSGRIETKADDSELLWGFRQKKYKRLQKFKFKDRVEYDFKTLEPLNPINTVHGFMLKSNLTIDSVANNLTKQAEDQNTFHYHNSIKFNRHRNELVPVNLARRLLRTKRTLVLPAHVNITVITNSYDVVHSWFIPGLGIKLDCVPGRSTHHSFYIDNIGFYYGQCAEICGRYHHHMPIRICALPFEQFLVWWKHRGLKRMHRIRMMYEDKKLVNTKNIAFRYKW